MDCSSGYSAADKSWPEPHGGSNSEETTNNCKHYRHARTAALLAFYSHYYVGLSEQQTLFNAHHRGY